MRRIIAVFIAITALIASNLAYAGEGENGLLSNIPRAQFVPNVPLGQIDRIPAQVVEVTPKLVDGATDDWDDHVVQTHLGGTTTIQGGQLIYQDWIGDDTGAARSCVVERRDRNYQVQQELGWSRYQSTDSALGQKLIPTIDTVGVFQHPLTECEKGLEHFGGAQYPAGTTEGAADILEFRMALDETHVYFLIRFNAMAPSDTPVVAIALDTDGKPSTGAGAWGFSSGVATPGADHVLTLTRTKIYLDGAPAADGLIATDDLGQGGPTRPDGFGGVIEASIPRSALEPQVPNQTVRRWQLWAGAGIWDTGTGTWQAPVTAEPGPRVFNLAFRSGSEPLRTWMDEQQSFELRHAFNASDDGVARLSDRFSQTVDIDALTAGAHETWRLRPGYYVRIFQSRVTDGQRNGTPHPQPESGPVSARQQYGLYIPKAFDPMFASPATVWLHWRGPGDHQSAYYMPNVLWELGERRGNIVVSPRGRGTSGWYVGDSQIDVLDAMDDAQELVDVDPERVYVAGYSMGGWGAYLLSMLYPDRFAGAFPIAAPPVLGFWPYPASPGDPQDDRPLYSTTPIVENARHVRTVIFHGSNDELVPVSGTAAHARTYMDNRQPHRYYLFTGYEHYTFALADEWREAAEYLGNHRRLRNPSRVTYSRMPCLDPVHWSPQYAETADSAYWLNTIRVRGEPSSEACTSAQTPTADLWLTGRIDFSIPAPPTSPAPEGPVAGAGGPPEHSGVYAMTGYDRSAQIGAPQNRFDAMVRNVSSFRVDVARSGLPTEPDLFGTIQTDGPVTVHLDGLAGGRLSVNGVEVGPFTGSISLASGSHHVAILRSQP